MCRGTGVFVPLTSRDPRKERRDNKHSRSKAAADPSACSAPDAANLAVALSGFELFVGWPMLPPPSPGSTSTTASSSECDVQRAASFTSSSWGTGGSDFAALLTPAPSVRSFTTSSSSGACFAATHVPLLAQQQQQQVLRVQPPMASLHTAGCPAPLAPPPAVASLAPVAVLVSSSEELLLMQQQEAEVDAAIARLLLAKQQLAARAQANSLPAAPAAATPYYSLTAVPMMPVSHATAAMAQHMPLLRSGNPHTTLQQLSSQLAAQQQQLQQLDAAELQLEAAMQAEMRHLLALL